METRLKLCLTRAGLEGGDLKTSGGVDSGKKRAVKMQA
jgi:hypothetical protein